MPHRTGWTPEQGSGAPAWGGEGTAGDQAQLDPGMLNSAPLPPVDYPIKFFLPVAFPQVRGGFWPPIDHEAPDPEKLIPLLYERGC